MILTTDPWPRWCTSTPVTTAPVTTPPALSQVILPRDVEPVTLTASGSLLVVGDRIIDVVTAGAGVVVLAGGDRSWTLTRGPLGEAVGSGLVAGWVDVITQRPGGSALLRRCPVKDLG